MKKDNVFYHINNKTTCSIKDRASNLLIISLAPKMKNLSPSPIPFRVEPRLLNSSFVDVFKKYRFSPLD